MSSKRIQSGPNVASTLHVETTRARTARKEEGVTFGSVLKAGAGAILRGVEVGATVVGGPILGAAVREVRQGVTAAPGGPLSGGGSATAAAAASNDEASTMDQVRALQEQAQEFNMQYLALQEEIQQENRKFTTLSNVTKAKYDTEMRIIGNVRTS